MNVFSKIFLRRESNSKALSYDAVTTTTRRRPPRTDVKSEDDHLNASDRRKLVSTTRDLRRNYSLAAWAIRKHLDYVACHSFQSKNGDEKLDNSIEKLVRWWELPKNFDLSARHGLHRYIRIAEASRTVDGDVLIRKMRNGLLQAIEGDRVANNNGASTRNDISDFKRGVKVDSRGRDVAYIINDRGSMGGRLIFNRVLSARNVIHFGYWDRFDQIRGVSPLASAINTFQDTYEGITYALARAKVSQLFGMVITRGSAGEVGASTGTGDTETETVEGSSGNKVDFGKGPIFLDLDEGDDAKFLESNQPAQEFQSFIEMMIALALKSLDIPYSFYNESFTNYSGARQALLMYEQSASQKRRDVQMLLNAITAWRIRLWILGGVLELPSGMTVSDLKWEWIPTGLPWIDPLKETLADNKAVEGNLNSRQRIVKRMGGDWNEVLDELEAEKKELDKRGLTETSPTGSTSGNSNTRN